MFPRNVYDCLKKIGEFYLQKNNGDYEAAAKEITELRITNVDVVQEYVVITTARPGILIGKRGTNIDQLSKFLGDKYKIHIKEEMNDILGAMIPRRPDPMDHWYDDFYDDFERDRTPDPICDPD